jgi:hypothetical protein
MSTLIPYLGNLALVVPDWIAAARTDCIPGSGIAYIGPTALVMAQEQLVLVTPNGQIAHRVFYESVIRVRDVEFRGLVIERDGVLVAPNETFGVEVDYKGAGNFERTVKLLTKSANNARALADEIAMQVGGYWDNHVRSGGIVRRTDSKQ